MIFKLKGKFQHYVWGGMNFIPNFLKLSDPDDKPYAEYWLGAHPVAPSEILFEQNWLPLDKVIETTPELLGEKIRTQFGDTLPYLLKILDIKQPLSIQVHPTKNEAEYGFEQENLRNIPLNAPNRIYKDANHKPEMMIALSDVWALHGFKPIIDIQAALQVHDSLKPIAQALEEKGLPLVYADIMQADKQQLAQWILPVVEAKREEYQADKLKLDNPDYWVCYIVENMQSPIEEIDGGLICFYFFNIVHMKKGEGLYQGAGLPHAYLRGQNIELMANSDNVIRGGLTPKYIDVPALLHSIDYRPITPKIIPPYQENDGFIHLYPTPEAKDFALQHMQFNAFDEENFTADCASILLVMKGSIYIDLGEESIYLQQGEAIFIAAESQVEIIAESDGYAVIATVP
ncbi:mannose-6-phosphate isomerase, class I [Actinobacillus pleuropneumoniae]|uniref:mannose-6-phosphate isomerase, class I n=1 Tax=Actinobacillus TaxID=713 RepID=UPI001EEED850|nr:MULTISPECIES: mannose-6-phosphate isomerase, class I [Actinobacillus]UKH16886.1 mannose-6-phosphate isomerase, class I [Actinobacillus pleuropneumoniae]UKH23081.1 mannose-6-phosphate isomerase, class I [Actinobacillus pleuropneumoniae]USQ16033.1 mannose-6-phosphate isomerase, class I [Actinobacillus pleuropneumoniae]WGE35402.1 mannose-6-phosphate isomerase, class I [Actinobacillus genomosp. 1]